MKLLQAQRTEHGPSGSRLADGLHRARRLARRTLAMALVAVALAGTLAACTQSDMQFAMVLEYSKLTDEEKAGYLARMQRTARDSPGLRMGLLHTNGLYIDWNEYIDRVFASEENFLKYGVGLALAMHPEITFKQVTQLAPGLAEVATEADFNYYRYTGYEYYVDMRSRPENRYLAEREALFLARAGIDVSGLRMRRDGDAYIALLRDDDAFQRFLTDEGFANVWLSQHRNNTKDAPWLVRDLGPAFQGVTPATGS